LGGVDLVSLDIDGNDYWVAASLSFEDVSIVVVEYNALFGPTHPVAVPRDDYFDRSKAHFSWLYYGASLRAFVELMWTRGFSFLGTNKACSNAFFVRRSQLIAFPLNPPSTDLECYTDCRVRESRDLSGKLSYLSRDRGLALIGHLPLIDTSTGAQLSVRDINSPSASAPTA
jgi:hypothetical protein